ncbi:MAG: protein ral secretion pathway protein [Candidatus Parcubacteria bacterium]|jgi:type IV pilus assembly protein PilA
MIKRRSEKGFTLIELLVVIAIIGMLAAIVLASLNGARQKGRDARRLSDLKQIANQVALLDTGAGATAFVGCTTAGSKVYTCTTPDLTHFKDPSSPSNACTTASSATCEYAVGKNSLSTASPDSQNWEVCTYLETKSGPLTTSGGLVYIDSNGTILAGCN